MRDAVVIIGLYLFAVRAVAYSEGTYRPNWVDIAGGLLIGYALAKVFEESL